MIYTLLFAILIIYDIKHVTCFQSISNITYNHLGAIMMMVSNWKDKRPARNCYFNKSIDMLEKNWSPHNSYPIILIDTKPWNYDDMKVIRNKWNNLNFKFINIQSIFNSVPNITISEFNDRLQPLSSIEYKRMCYFFIKGFTKISLLMEYKYLFRLDDDTCIIDPINYDLFQYLNEKHAEYAYVGQFIDSSDVVKGLFSFTKKYLKQNKLIWKNKNLKNITRIFMRNNNYRLPAYSTNLEVINTIRYRQDDIISFIDTIDQSNHIFHSRWGDAPVRYMISMMFWLEEYVIRICDFEYLHSNWKVFPMCEENILSHTSFHPHANFIIKG